VKQNAKPENRRALTENTPKIYRPENQSGAPISNAGALVPSPVTTGAYPAQNESNQGLWNSRPKSTPGAAPIKPVLREIKASSTSES
jgi:hypothetical protein